MFYTYIILNTITNKRYVGKTDDISQRFRAHKSVAFNKNAEGYNYPFYSSIRKYAKTADNFENVFIFELIEEFDSEFDAFAKEIYYIDLYKTNIRRYGKGAQGYNLTDGGEGPKGTKWSLESRKRFSEKTKGRKISEDNVKKLIAVNTGKIVSDETRRKISESKMGDKNPSYGKSMSDEMKRILSDATKGKPGRVWTEEEKLASSEARKGKPGHPQTEEVKQKLSESRRGDKGSNAKLTWEIVAQIRSEYIEGIIGYVKLSKKYEVAVGTIAGIIKNRTWKIESKEE
jgi:group I intron endonuclease